MKPIFADAWYFLALLNTSDQDHKRAADFSATNDQPILTTTWVLTEVGDALCRSTNRAAFKALLDGIRSDPDTTVITADQAHWERAVQLYHSRSDKDWSLTDCISFVVMKEFEMTDALTADRHFEQAGFYICS
jgi:predicted nucleic acid-binding protein